MYDLNNPPSSPFDTSAAIPILVRPNMGIGADAPAEADKVLHKAFWPALAGVVGLVWFFSRTDKE